MTNRKSLDFVARVTRMLEQGKMTALHMDELRERTRQAETERDEMRKLALRLIDIGYKALAREHHPDKGGSAETMARLNKARDHFTRMVAPPKAQKRKPRHVCF